MMPQRLKKLSDLLGTISSQPTELGLVVPSRLLMYITGSQYDRGENIGNAPLHNWLLKTADAMIQITNRGYLHNYSFT